MESSISSLTFRGSITVAIHEAKKQKKLFVVYLSGEDADSVRLNETTWTDSCVAESISKYCILLHMSEGSIDAAHFSAIYPQSSVPCITAVGFNGIQVWKNEGFVSAETLASTLEKAWLTLHIQETTATVLGAALASKQSEPSSSGASSSALLDPKKISTTDVPSPSVDEHVQTTESRLTSAAVEKNKNSKCTVEDNSELGAGPSSRSIHPNKLEVVSNEESNSLNQTHEDFQSPETVALDEPEVTFRSIAIDGQSSKDENVNLHDRHSRVPNLISEIKSHEEKEAVRDGKAEAAQDKKPEEIIKSSDVHLNIRLPDGSSLQEKFSLTSTLRMVKDHVDKNKMSVFGSYDLAIPYPRKIFTNQDLSKSLSDLELFNRQALIVVPHQGSAGKPKGGSSSSHQQTSSTTDLASSSEGNAGYFSKLKWILSYANPLSYLGGTNGPSASGHESQSSSRQYRPNPMVQNNATGTERPYARYSPNQSAPQTSGTDSNSKKPTTSRFGSNIHTLKHDEDERFSDKNAFWNGNSTQYGGDNDGK